MRVLRGIGRAVLALLIAYAAATLAGGLWPVNAGWTQASEGVRIYVVDNGIHTDLVLPAGDFGDLIEPKALGDPRAAGLSHVMFGWGDRDFYLNTPNWSDADPLRIGRAMLGGGATVMHATHTGQPQIGKQVRTLLLRPEEYRRLAHYVRASFAPGEAVKGYGARDAFYPAIAGYSAIRTCNEWTGQALRVAGVRMGAWTPLPFGVMQWL